MGEIGHFSAPTGLPTCKEHALDPGVGNLQSARVNRAINSGRVSLATFSSFLLMLVCVAPTDTSAQTNGFLDDSRCGHWLARMSERLRKAP